MPVVRLIEVAHRHGALALVDGAHGPGQVPTELLTEVVEGADFFTGLSYLPQLFKDLETLYYI